MSDARNLRRKALKAARLPSRWTCLFLCALVLFALLHGNGAAAPAEDTAQPVPETSDAAKDADTSGDAALSDAETRDDEDAGRMEPPAVSPVETPGPPLPAAAPTETDAETAQHAAEAEKTTEVFDDQSTLHAARDAINACWKAGAGLYLYGQNFDRCGHALEAPLTAWLEARPRLTAGKSMPGARLLMRTSSRPPNFTRVPAPLYLLLENAEALPEVLRAPLNEARRVLADTPLEGMADGPLLLRLHPQKSTTGPLLRWYLSEGAAQGRSLILGSRQEVDALIRRVASWHLMLWERGEGAPAALLARPTNPGLLQALLPLLRGKAAALFAGPGDGLWFRTPTPRGAQWYDIRAERALPVLETPDATLTLPRDQVRSILTAFNADYELRTAEALRRATPDRRISPEKTLEFVRRATRHINALPDVPGALNWGQSARQAVLELLWQAYGTPRENAVAHALLTPDDTPLEARLEAARALLH